MRKQIILAYYIYYINLYYYLKSLLLDYFHLLLKKAQNKAQKMMFPEALYYHNIRGYIDIYTKTRLTDVAFQLVAGLLSLDDAKILGDETVIDAYREHIKRLNNLLPKE